MPRTYEELNAILQGRNHSKKKLANNTYAIRRELGAIAIQLHETDVLTFMPDKSVVVTSGGWKTVTTKDRINTYLPSGYRIFQSGGVWYWAKPQQDGFQDVNHSTIFTDGDTISKRGKLVTSGNGPKEKELKALRKQINNFAAFCAEKVPLPLPGPGDCFYCQMVVSDGPNKGQTLGDAHKNTDHLRRHMEEGYCVPSLVLRALQERGYGPMILNMAFNPDGENAPKFKTDVGNISRDYVKRAVARYLTKRFNMA